MLKHMIYTSVALAIASTSLVARASESNIVNPQTPSSNINQQSDINSQQSSIPAKNIVPAKAIDAYEGLEMGYRGTINAHLRYCRLMNNSDIPQMIQFRKVFFSSDKGSKVTLDPFGNAQTVYHFNNSNEVYNSDLDRIRVKRFIEIGKNYSRVVIRTAKDNGSEGKIKPVWSTFEYKCNNRSVHFLR
ncbi:hypothetical protein JQC92_07035 [Shewanella sp. 202IG2-18]|uniref:hypothetical protein n=1 Tax=Parashewanella hymeniacidonis TaxID=2807618 RepID=UPI0019618B86|nr:hypothetical protein [Parashewanella hymeniacidonis]MBM7071798.1 hypothetical protein [Parashewanella hymeniacidonis]